VFVIRNGRLFSQEEAKDLSRDSLIHRCRRWILRIVFAPFLWHRLQSV